MQNPDACNPGFVVVRLAAEISFCACKCKFFVV